MGLRKHQLAFLLFAYFYLSLLPASLQSSCNVVCYHPMNERYKHIYLPSPLTGQTISLEADLSKRLSRVLRMRHGHKIAVFNGHDGLWLASLDDDKAKSISLIQQLKPQPEVSPFKLFIALPKRDAMTSVLRQATELGITHIQPLLTDHCVADKLNSQRTQAVLIEAAEQCERLTVPQLEPLRPLQDVLKEKQAILWCAEHAGDTPFTPDKNAAVLIGPEGGFSQAEKDLLTSSPHVKAVGLGNTILRVDTAVISALAIQRLKS